MSRYALRVTDGQFTGDIVTVGRNATWTEADRYRRQIMTPTEVVELDDDGNVLDHAHEVVTTQAAGRTRHYCLTCGATTYNRAPALPCPGRPS